MNENTEATRIIPAPTVYPETREYWEAANSGRLLLKWCLDCKEYHHYPRSICPRCFGPRTEWRAASGHGSVYSYSVTRRAAVPYVIAYVTLDEGVSMMTNIVGCGVDDVRIGQRVRAVFVPSDGGPAVPMFAPT